MRLVAIVLSFFLVFTAGAILVGRSAEGQQHLRMAGNGQQVVGDATTAINALYRQITTIASGSTIKGPDDVATAITGVTLNGTMTCPSGTCSYSATSSPYSLGGGTRTASNENTALDANGQHVTRDVPMRLTVSADASGTSAASMSIIVQILDSSPITVQIIGERSDQKGKLSSGSLDLTDQLCGTAALSCSTLTSGSDTTVVQSQEDCFEQTHGAVDVANGCSPLGLPTALPTAANNYQVQHSTDNTIGGAAPGTPQ